MGEIDQPLDLQNQCFECFQVVVPLAPLRKISILLGIPLEELSNGIWHSI